MIGSKIGLGRGSAITGSTLVLAPPAGTVGPALDVVMTGAGAGQAALTARLTRTATAGAGNIGGLDVYMSGTLNATAAARNAVGAYFEAIATRSAGANPVSNIAMCSYAAGGQVNRALETFGGEVKFNGTAAETGSTVEIASALGGSGSGTSALKVTNTPAANAGNSTGIQGISVGTLDATAAARIAAGAYFESSTTRSAGANTVTNKAVIAYAAGGQVNVALETLGGDVRLCAAADKLGYFGNVGVVKQTAVPVTAAGIHAALVAYGLIAA